jgi:hypothetical protein
LAVVDSPKDAFMNKELRYSNHLVGRAEYAGKVRELAVAFVDKNEYIEVITIHPLKPGQKDKRISTGRWVAK